jgi:hypothetical protein
MTVTENSPAGYSVATTGEIEVLPRVEPAESPMTDATASGRRVTEEEY